MIKYKRGDTITFIKNFNKADWGRVPRAMEMNNMQGTTHTITSTGIFNETPHISIRNNTSWIYPTSLIKQIRRSKKEKKGIIDVTKELEKTKTYKQSKSYEKAYFSAFDKYKSK